MPAHATDLVAVIDALAEGPVMLVGHSMGGFVTAVAAARHPALATDWSQYVERYLEADLFPDGDVLRPSAREEAVIADTESDLREGSGRGGAA